jgi:hypothetical protein
MAKFKDNGGVKSVVEEKQDFLARLISWIKENFSTIILPLIAIVLLALGIYFYSSPTAKTPITTDTKKEITQIPQDKQKNQDLSKKTQEQNAQNVQKDSNKNDGTGGPEVEKIENYTEKAAKGEGVTHLARKALKRYLSFEPVPSLTKEHKIYIEDYMKDRIGSFKLKVGQEITFSSSLIKEAISSAMKLTQNQLNNLKQYSKLVPSL